MALFPPELPWLSKPAAMREAGRLIADSAQRARGLLGYLDYAEGGAEPFWRAAALAAGLLADEGEPPPARRLPAPRRTT